MKKSESQYLLTAGEGADLHTLQPLTDKHSAQYIERRSTCPYCGRSAIQDAMYFSMLLRASGKQLYKAFEPLARVGSGSFGTVIKVLHRINGIALNVYAIKQIPIDFGAQPWLRQTLQEVDVLQRLYHPNVIRYYFAWTEEVQTNVNDVVRPHLMILLEYAKAGSLCNLKQSVLGRRLTEREFLILLYQASLAVDHLHSLGIISRDVKPENFLLTATAPETQSERFCPMRPNSKLEERIIAREHDSEQVNKRQQLAYIAEVGVENLILKAADFGYMGDGVSAGTEILTAPEVFASRKHTKASDIFSLGVSFLQLISDVPLVPFADEYYQRLIDGFIASDFSQNLKNVVILAINRNPKMRPTANELCDILAGLLCKLDRYTTILNKDEQETRLLQIKDFAVPAHVTELPDENYSNYEEKEVQKKTLTCTPPSQKQLRYEKLDSEKAHKELYRRESQIKKLMYLVWLVLGLYVVLLFK